MASPAVMAHVNGVAAPPSRPASPASVNSTSTKRKRDATDDGDTLLPDAPSSPKPLVNGVHPFPDSKSLVADFVRVLERYAAAPVFSLTSLHRFSCHPRCTNSGTPAMTRMGHPFSAAGFPNLPPRASPPRSVQNPKIPVANPCPLPTRCHRAFMTASMT
jgi:hypothetical protein